MDHARGEWSLIFFTTLTQMAVGAFALWGLGAGVLPSPSVFSTGLFSVILLSTVLAALFLGSLSATTHLGRPLGAVFSLSNWRRSWLSREALLAGGFGLMVMAALVLRLMGTRFGWADRLLILIGMLAGFSLVWGISRLYRLRTVPAWDNLATPAAFFTTSLLTGLVAIRLIWFAQEILEPILTRLPMVALFKIRSDLLIFLLVLVQAVFFCLLIIYLTQQGSAGAESVRILWQRHRLALILRWVMAAVGVLLLNLGTSPEQHLSAYFLLLASELIGRFLFYAFYQRTGF